MPHCTKRSDNRTRLRPCSQDKGTPELSGMSPWDLSQSCVSCCCSSAALNLWMTATLLFGGGVNYNGLDHAPGFPLHKEIQWEDWATSYDTHPMAPLVHGRTIAGPCRQLRLRSSPEGHTGPDHAQFSVNTTAVRNTAVLVSTAGTPNYPK